MGILAVLYLTKVIWGGIRLLKQKIKDGQYNDFNIMDDGPYAVLKTSQENSNNT